MFLFSLLRISVYHSHLEPKKSQNWNPKILVVPKLRIPRDSVSISFSQPSTIPVFHDHCPLVLHNSPRPSSTTSFSPATLRTRVHPTTTASLQSPPGKLLCLSCFSGSLFSVGNYQRLGVLFFPCPFFTLMQ